MHRRRVIFLLTFGLVIAASTQSMASDHPNLCTGEAVVVTEPDRAGGGVEFDMVFTSSCGTHQHRRFTVSWPPCDDDDGCPGNLPREDYVAVLQGLSVGHVLTTTLECLGDTCSGKRPVMGGLSESFQPQPFGFRTPALDDLRRLSSTEVEEILERSERRSRAEEAARKAEEIAGEAEADPAESPRSRVVIRRGEIIGDAVDVENIISRIREDQHELENCHDHVLQSDPNVTGRMTMSFVLHTGKVVVNPAVVDMTIGSSQVESCVLRQARTWRFDDLDDLDDVEFVKVTVHIFFEFDD